MKHGLFDTVPKKIVMLMLAIFAISTVDYVLTCYGINSGLAYEKNPMLSWLSLEGIGLVKVAGLTVLFVLDYKKTKTLIFCAVVLSMAVAWNIFVLSRLLWG